MFFQPLKSVVDKLGSFGTLIAAILEILSLNVAVITSDFKISFLFVITFSRLILSVANDSSNVVLLSTFNTILIAFNIFAISPRLTISPEALYVFFQPFKFSLDKPSFSGTTIPSKLVTLSFTVAVITSDFKIIS